MFSFFPVKKSAKNKIPKRILRIESLENRELLSVSPLGINPLSAMSDVDYGQYDTAQEFHTEDGYIMFDESQTTYHSVTFRYEFDSENCYKLCVAELDQTVTGTTAQGTVVVKPTDGNEGTWTVTGLTAGKTYYFEVWKSRDNGITEPYVKDKDFEIDTRIVTIPTITDAKLIKTRYYSSSNENKSELDLQLFDLPPGYTESDISITGTYGINGTEKNLAQNVHVEGNNTGEFFINIGDLNDGEKVKITKIKIGSDIELFAGRVFNATSDPVAETPTANVLSSASGITSGSVTLTWTKPSLAQSNAPGNPLVDVTAKYDKKDITTDYKITLENDFINPSIYYSQGKTTLSVTDLISGSYSYKIEARLIAKDSKNILLKDSDGYTVLASGLFETEYLSIAGRMAVGQPTDVKTVPTDTNVKITWKAPVNYTGGYKITITNQSYLTTGSFFVVAGAKMEAALTIGNNEFLSGTNQNLWTLKKGNRYEVAVVSTSGNDNGLFGLTSTPTNFLAQKTQTDPLVTIPELTTSAAVKTATTQAPTSANILSAKSIDRIEYSMGNPDVPVGWVNFSIEEYDVSGSKILPEQYYVVLRDANKAVIASEYFQSSGRLYLERDVILSPKSKYTVEVYGVFGTTISTAKTTKTFTVEDYPVTSVKLAGGTKVSLDSIAITISGQYDGYRYLQYTNIVDAKGKPDWNTAIIEKLDSGNLSTYVLGSGTMKLKPNTQYYVRVVTANANVAYKGNQPHFALWSSGNDPLQRDSWWEATRVVFGKELKVKTAAVPLAVISKSGLSVDKQSNLALKAVGQTMLAAKGADDFFGKDKPLNGASFGYMLIVSTDSKVDKVTGKLLGGTEISLYPSDITITALSVKNGNVIENGQYTIECALTGNDGFGIFETMGLSSANISALKTLNFQLVTFVSYGTRNGFISITKPSKVTMPKWFT